MFVEKVSSAVLVSDVHLSEHTPERLGLLIAFLRSQVRKVERGYILGDLFDFWVGPGQARLTAYRRILAELRSVREAGLPLGFVHGNRDFRVGRNFQRQTGIEVLGDEAVLDSGGRRILITHGDVFCTRDVGHQRFRRLTRSRTLGRLFDHVPLDAELAIGRAARWVSRRTVPRKTPGMLAIVPEAVERVFDEGWDAIVCGHVHRMSVMDFTRDGATRKLYVLGEWTDSGSSAEMRDGEIRLFDVLPG